MEDHFELFFKANQGRIYYQMRRLGIAEESCGEFYSEGILALWHGYKSYNPTKGEFGTFLNYQIRYRLLDLIRKKSRVLELDEQGNLEEKMQIDQGNRHRGTNMPIPDVRGVILESHAFWLEVRSELTEKQWKWVHYFIIADLTIKEIMEIENVTSDAVKSWAREVRKKLNHEDIRKKLEALM